jgi:archaemetzincin
MLRERAAGAALLQGKRNCIYLQPLGFDAAPSDLAFVVAMISQYYSLTVKISSAIPLPSRAYSRVDARFRGEFLLDILEAHIPSNAIKVVGLLARDMTMPVGHGQRRGVVGISALGEDACVVSTCRLPGAAHSRRTLLAKAILHELGHAFGLEHCPQSQCLMHAGNGSLGYLRHSEGYCGQCRERLPFSVAGAIERRNSV